MFGQKNWRKIKYDISPIILSQVSKQRNIGYERAASYVREWWISLFVLVCFWVVLWEMYFQAVLF